MTTVYYADCDGGRLAIFDDREPTAAEVAEQRKQGALACGAQWLRVMTDAKRILDLDYDSGRVVQIFCNERQKEK